MRGKILRIQQIYNLTTYNTKYYNLLLQKKAKSYNYKKRVRNKTIQYKTMHTGQNTKHTDKTAATLYNYKRGGGGGGGERKEKNDICVAEDMNCKMKVNMNVLCKHKI